MKRRWNSDLQVVKNGVDDDIGEEDGVLGLAILLEGAMAESRIGAQDWSNRRS